MRSVLFPLLLATVLSAQDITPEVQQLYASAQAAQRVNDSALAERNYRRILELAPTVAPAYNNLGRILFDSNRDAEAEDILSRGLALDPTMIPAQIMLGAIDLRLGKPAQALPLLQSSHSASPEDAFASLTLAETFSALNRPAEALAVLDPLLTPGNTDQQAWYLAGKLHLQLSQSAFARVQNLGKDTPLATIMTGEIMESMQNTPGAVAAYKRAQSAEGPTPAGASRHLADLYWKNGDWFHAAAQYDAIVAGHPLDCVARWRLANSHVELGDSPEASLSNLNAALAECPVLVQAHADRARLELRLNHPEPALKDLLSAQAGAPDEPSIQQLLAQTYRLLGQKKQADSANARFAALQAQQHHEKEENASTVQKANER